MLNLTIRHPSGQTRISIGKDATLEDLKTEVEKCTAINKSWQKLLMGYPPSPLDGDGKTLSSLGVRGGTLIVQKSEIQTDEGNNNNNNVDSSKTRSGQIGDMPAVPSKGGIVRRIVDADNSCLFNCFGYCLENKSRSKSREMRSIVSSILLSKESIYTEAFLNKSNKDYRAWIMNDNAWGGGIELAILSEYFKCEVGSFDIQSTRMDLYGEGNNYTKRIYVLYDGIHYDPLAWAENGSLSPEQEDITVFSPLNFKVEQSALELAKELHKAHKFTDTSKFTLRCLVCGKGLAGEADAMKHAQGTKPHHTNFAEYLK